MSGAITPSAAAPPPGPNAPPESMNHKTYTGLLDLEEFAVAMQLVEDVKAGGELPEALSWEYIPPSKRGLFGGAS